MKTYANSPNCTSLSVLIDAMLPIQFHRALDAVTKVMKSSQRRDHEEQPICTVVTPSFNQLLQEMWQPQISMVMLSDRYPRFVHHIQARLFFIMILVL